MYTAAGLLSGAPRPMPVRNALRADAPRPVLIPAGADPGRRCRRGRTGRGPLVPAASSATVHVWVAPQTGHTAALATQPHAWESRVTSFLDAALNPLGHG